MKKILKIAAIILVIALIVCMVYLIPVFKKMQEEKVLNAIKENNSVFISKIIEGSANDKYILPSVLAQKVASELNSVQKNPYYASGEFYVLKNECTACTKVECDDNLGMVIITTLDKKGLLVARTVIKAPSFVTYYKEDDKK